MQRPGVPPLPQIGVAWHSQEACLPASQVWDFDESAEKRDTEGGVSKRSVLEQCQKLKDHLASYD